MALQLIVINCDKCYSGSQDYMGPLPGRCTGGLIYQRTRLIPSFITSRFGHLPTARLRFSRGRRLGLRFRKIPETVNLHRPKILIVHVILFASASLSRAVIKL